MFIFRLPVCLSVTILPPIDGKKSLVFFSDKCIVQVISPSTVDKTLWINSDEGKFYQAIAIYVRGKR